MVESKEEFVARAARIADALQWMRSPRQLIVITELIPEIAFHLARAGTDVHPDKAIIKRQAIPNRPGQVAGMCNWVPIDTPDRTDGLEPPTAQGDIDLDALDDALPWHVKTKFEGAFQ